MKHKIINSEHDVPFNKYDNIKNYIEERHATDIGIFLFKEGLLETTYNHEGDKVRIRSNTVVIKTSDYERMMEYLKRIKDYVFYDRETGEVVRLEDLI